MVCRREAVEQNGAAAVAQILEDGEAVVDEEHSGEDNADAAMEQALQQAGLVSDDDIESDEGGGASSESKGKSTGGKGGGPHSRGESPDGGQSLLGPIFPKDTPGGHGEGSDSEEEAESHDEATAMEADEGEGPSTSGRQSVYADRQNPKLIKGGTAGNTSASGSGKTLPSRPTIPKKAKSANSSGVDQPQESGKGMNALDPLGGEDFVPFDYAAARNTAPGLDLGLARAEQNGRGRGGELFCRSTRSLWAFSQAGYAPQKSESHVLIH